MAARSWGKTHALSTQVVHGMCVCPCVRTEWVFLCCVCALTVHGADFLGRGHRGVPLFMSWCSCHRQTPLTLLMSQSSSCLLDMHAFEPLAVLSSTKEGSGGIYAIILASLFPLSFWLFMKRGEWLFLSEDCEGLYLAVRGQWGCTHSYVSDI